MKQCPACKTKYTDITLSFCLEDGTPLVEAEDEQQTVVRQANVDPIRVNVSEHDDQTAVRNRQPATGSGAGTAIKIVVAVVLLIIAAIAALGLAGAAYYYGTATSVSDKTPTPVPVTPTPSVDREKERLSEEIANIQKRLDEQKKNASPSDDDPGDNSVIATVNSPNDGFLALRTEPDADRGTRLAKIPHGHTVEIMNCEKQAVTIGGRSGRWCLVEYNGQTGWVFDGFLDY